MRSIIYGTEAYSTRLPRTGREGAICYFELFWGRVCFCDFALVGDMIPALMGGGLGFVRFRSGVLEYEYGSGTCWYVSTGECSIRLISFLPHFFFCGDSEARY